MLMAATSPPGSGWREGGRERWREGGKDGGREAEREGESEIERGRTPVSSILWTDIDLHLIMRYTGSRQ